VSVPVDQTNEIFTFVGEDIAVETWPAWEPEDVLEGDPVHRGAVLYRDPTKRLSYGIWECDPGKFRLEYGPMTEMIHVLQGRATVTNLDTGHATHLEPGSRMVVPVGTVVTWHVHEPFRKVYAAYEEEWDEHRYY
jgi:uncharacterized cupin superfamily protein